MYVYIQYVRTYVCICMLHIMMHKLIGSKCIMISSHGHSHSDVQTDTDASATIDRVHLVMTWRLSKIM